MPTPSINLIKASDGTGNAAMATVQSTRAPLATTLIVDTVDNIPATFIGTMGTPHTFVDPITAEEIVVISEATAVDFTGHVDGTNLEIDAIPPGFTDNGSSAGDVIIIKPTTEWANNLANLLDVAHNDDGTLKAVVANQGWTEITGTTISGNPTYNGNRSYTITFSADMSATLSQGMRLLFTKTVPGNGYMGGALNGTNQYFTKTSPTGALGTVTNNFTLMAQVRPTSYTNGVICARSDATPANGIALRTQPSGIVEIVIYNGGAANYRVIPTLQSLSLGRTTHIAVTFSSGAVAIKFDGINVPLGAVITSGTAPTTAGTGGDFSIGRHGAFSGQYFSGYISNVAIFDAVLADATIRSYSTYKLTGSETNCIGAWSLDNTPNDQSSLGNNLTAQNSAGFTAISPHGQMGNGVQTTKACARVMEVNGANVTVQTPEGCTIPTSGGISSVSYATSGVPFGWVDDSSRRWDEPWQGATLLNNWLNYGTPYALAAFTKDSLGYVHIKGFIKSGTVTAGTPIFNLPVGYRPAESNYYNTGIQSSGSGGVFEVTAGGDVKVVAANATYTSLGHISFKAEV